MPIIRILPGGRFSLNSAINIAINGARLDIPVGEIVTVSDEVLQIIRDTGATFTYGDGILNGDIYASTLNGILTAAQAAATGADQSRALAAAQVPLVTAQASLAGHLANDNTDTAVPGQADPTARGAKWWASKAAEIVSSLSASVASVIANIGAFKQITMGPEASDDILTGLTDKGDVLWRYDKDGVFRPTQMLAPINSVPRSALYADLDALIARALPVEFGDLMRVQLGTNILFDFDPAGGGFMPAKATLPSLSTFLSDSPLPLADRLSAGGAFSARANGGYYAELYVDGNAKQQVRTYRTSDGVGPFFPTNGGGNKRDPSLTDEGYLFVFEDGVGTRLIHPETGAARVLVPNNLAIAAVGDSKTAGGSGYAQTLFNLYAGLGRSPMTNLGIGSQKIDQVLVRINWFDTTMTIAGGAIPTSGSVKATPAIRFLDGAGGTRGTRITVAGVSCAIIWDGIANSDYDLTPITYPGSPVATAGDVPFTVTGTLTTSTVTVAACAALPTLTAALAGYISLRFWRNDVSADLSAIDPLLDKIVKGSARTALMKHMVIVGETNAPGDTDANVVWLATANAKTRARFPNNFIDLMAIYTANGYTTPRVINGVTYQVCTAAIMGTDGFHDNATGWALCAAAIKALADSKGNY